MNTHAQSIAPTELVGPVNSLLQRLAGPNGRFWLNALNRLNRKENPWVPFVSLYRRTFGTAAIEKENVMSILKEWDINVFDELKDLGYSHFHDPAPETPEESFLFVSVKLGDLISSWHEWEKIGYRGLLNIAEENGFLSCTVGGGIFYARSLIHREAAANMGAHEYVFCTTPIEFQGGVERVPRIHVHAGVYEGGKLKGTACMYTIKDHKFSPETRLIFASIPS